MLGGAFTEMRGGISVGIHKWFLKLISRNFFGGISPRISEKALKKNLKKFGEDFLKHSMQGFLKQSFEKCWRNS